MEAVREEKMREKLKVHDGDTPGKVIEVKLEYLKPKVATMSDMKCPFCNSELDMNMCGECGCPNEQCQKSVFMFGSEELWQELIRTKELLALETENKDLSDKIGKLELELERTRKALEIIKKEMSNEYMPDFAVIRDALKTALEQKDVK